MPLRGRRQAARSRDLSMRALLVLAGTLLLAVNVPSASFAGPPPGAAGPMAGTWRFTVKGKEWNPEISKPFTFKSIIDLAVTDSSAGGLADITMLGTDNEGKPINPVGKRVGLGFVADDVTADKELHLAGHIGAPKDGISKKMSGAGGQHDLTDEAVDSITLKAKRLP